MKKVKREEIIQTLTEFFCADVIKMDPLTFAWGEQTRTTIDVNPIRIKIQWEVSNDKIPEDGYEKLLDEFKYHVIDISKRNLEPIMYDERRNEETTVIDIYITNGYEIE